MSKRLITICALILSIIAVLLFIIRTTYSLVINISERENNNMFFNNISIRELITDKDGIYITEYYDAIKELDIDSNEANILIDSEYLNTALNKMLNSIVNYQIKNKKRISPSEISSILIDAINNDKTINNELKEKVITKINQYIYDISDFIYGISSPENVN